jgi:hypothetical protein
MKRAVDTSDLVEPGETEKAEAPPTPSMQFRRRAWLSFQRALDPLAPPKRLPTKWPR